MRKNIFTEKPKSEKSKANFLNRKELTGFLKEQFDQLLEKNIRVPIKLYHL